MVFEDSGLEQVRPEDFIVKIVQKGDGVLDNLVYDGEWAVKGNQVLHEFYDISPDDFLKLLGIEPEVFNELEVIYTLNVLLQHQDYYQALVIVVHLLLSTCVQEKFHIQILYKAEEIFGWKIQAYHGLWKFGYLYQNIQRICQWFWFPGDVVFHDAWDEAAEMIEMSLVFFPLSFFFD